MGEDVMKLTQMRTTAFWAATILGPASFVIGGVLGVTHDASIMSTLQHLGYPPYFATLAGAWKILGALAIVAPGLPRLKEWAYAGFFFELTSAAFSRASVGDSVADILAPLGFLALVAASWALRPASRRLASGHRNHAGAALVEAPPTAALAVC
jgi:uncharacterized membrane protein YphA (DoxX/SURF4 family)